MRKLPPLNAVRAFEAAARRLSFTAAADELGVTVTAVSHQIRLLEDTLGMKLFERQGRSIVLTAAAERLYPQVRDGFDKLAEAFSETNRRRSGEAIAVSTTRAFAERWLMPRLDRFNAGHPGIIVNIDASEDVVDLSADGIDLAIRYGRQRPDRPGETLLFEDAYAPVASVALCPPDRAPTIDDVMSRPLLGYRWKKAALDGPTWTTWFEALGRTVSDAVKISWYSEETLALQALERGFGALLCSSVLVADQVAAGDLRRIEGPVLGGYSFRLLVGASARRKRSVRTFTDWLQQEAAV